MSIKITVDESWASVPEIAMRELTLEEAQAMLAEMRSTQRPRDCHYGHLECSSDEAWPICSDELVGEIEKEEGEELV